MGTYCWLAVRDAKVDVFLGENDVLQDEVHSNVEGHNVGVCQLDSGWAVKFISGDCYDSESVPRLAQTYAAESELILVNMASSVTCSDFYWCLNSDVKCSLQHNGCDNGINDLRKFGRLPNGGREIVDNVCEQQKGVTDVDYIFDIPALLGELKTNYRVEGAECEAKPIGGWRLIE